MTETGDVTLSDRRVTLRVWRRDDAPFMADASADPAIRRFNGAHDRQGRPAPPLTIEEAEGAIDGFALSWREFVSTGTPTGVAFAITDAESGELVGCCGVDDWTGEDVAQSATGSRHRPEGRGTRLVRPSS